MSKIQPAEGLVYVATEQMWVNNSIVNAGDTFRYTGRPSANMVPTCDEGRKRLAESAEYDRKGRFENPAPVETLREAVGEDIVKKAKAKAAKIEKGAEEEFA